jgi:hypothetical protein
MKKILILLLILPIFVFGQIGINTTALTPNYLLTINPSNNTFRGGIDINLSGMTSTSNGIRISTGNSSVNGIFVNHSSTALSTSLYGIGSVLSSTRIVSGYLGYRTGSGRSYGLYGINGINTSNGYTTNSNTWALFSQGRAVISGESFPSSPLGVDLEVRNTTLGPGNPATLSLRQSTQNSTSGSVMSYINFGDNYTVNPQAQISVIRGDTSSNNLDIPTNITFSTIPDGSNSLTERVRILHNGNVGIGSSTPNSTLTFNGGLQGKVRVINTDSNVTLDNTDFFVISTNTFSDNRTMTLPTLTTGTTDGKILIIRNGGLYGSNGWNLTAATDNTLSVAGIYSNPLVGESGVILVSRGTVWYVISF